MRRSRGRRGCSNTPPPPAGGGKSRGPSGRGLNEPHFITSGAPSAERVLLWCWPDCVQFCCVLRDQLAITSTQVRGGGESTRAHVHTRLPYLANGWADYVQILCVTRDPLDSALHMSDMECICTCAPLFHISQTTGRIAFKFCM